MGMAAFVGSAVLFSPAARAACTVVGNIVQCDATSTVNAVYPAAPPNDRAYSFSSASLAQLTVDAGATITGFGLAISNAGTGGVTVTNNGTISVDAGNVPDAGGIGTAALSIITPGPITYTGGSIINNGDGNGVNVQQNGAGATDVNVSGNIVAANGIGIIVRSTSSDMIKVTTGAVTAYGAGIDVASADAIGDLTIVANGDIRAGGRGIIAVLTNGLSGSIDITANGAINANEGIVASNLGTGSMTVKAVGPITATGYGISAFNDGPDISVTAGAVTSTGNTAIRAVQDAASGAGTVHVTAGGAVSGTTGIEATNNGMNGIRVIANSTVTGTSAEGIKATGNGAVDVQVAGTVAGATRGLSLVGGTGGSGNISVTGAGGFVGGSGDAAKITNNGSGTVTVNISGASSSTSGGGIVVTDTAAGGDIKVTTGAVTALAAGKNGIDVQSSSTAADLTIVANGDIRAGNYGIVGNIFALGSGNIDVTANGAIDAPTGIFAVNYGPGSTTVKTVGPVNATNTGILASSRTALSVTTGAVTSTNVAAISASQGDSAIVGTIKVTTNGAILGGTGIRVENLSTGTNTVIAYDTVTGTNQEGIVITGGGAADVQVAKTVTGATRGLSLVGGTGNISVTGVGGFVGGSDDAANIQNNGSGTVTVNISGASSSTSGNGIVVTDTAAGGDIKVTTGAVTALAAGKIGIEVQSSSTAGNLTIMADGDVKAGNTGIYGRVSSVTGNLDITSNGAVDAGSGIIAQNFGTGSVNVKAMGPVVATMASGFGVYAQGRGGNVSVTTGAVTSTGGQAVYARQSGATGSAGTIDVTTNGNVSGTIGIVASNSGAGAISVRANAAVTGTSGEGILASGASGVDVQVAGMVMGATRGLTLIGGTGTIGVAASGTIRNLSGLSSDAAIDASGGPITLANAGYIVGTVNLSAGADTFTNSGTWRTAGGASDFGGGGDTLRNTASGILDAASAGAPATTVFNNLALFVNQGRLTTANGIGGDVIQTSGNTQFESGSVYAIDISAGVSDRFIAVGTAQLAGTLAVSVSGASGSTRYTVLTANGGVSGRFETVTGASTFLVLRDSYDANNAYLDVTKRAFASAGLTPNQIATGGGLDSLPASGTLYNAIFNLATDAQARTAFDQLSGEAHASLSTVLAEDSRFIRTGALDRLRSAFDAPGAASVPVMSYAPGGPSSVRIVPSESFAIWGQAYGAWGRWGGDGNAARLNRSAGGFTTGIDTALFSTAALPVRIGLLAGYSNTNVNTANRSASGTSDNYHMGAYAGTQWGSLGLRAGVVQTWHDIRTSRVVAFPGFTDFLRGNYDARTTQVFGDLGYRIDAGRFGFEPFANLAYVNLRTNGFREMGGAAALTSQGRTSSVTFSTLGLRASSQFDLGGMALTARGTLGWRHAFGAVTPQAVFAFAGGTPFAISGIAIARNAAVVEAGLDLQITPAATLGVSYSGQFARAANDQSLKGNLAVKF